MAVFIDGFGNPRMALYVQWLDQVAQCDFHVSARDTTPGKLWSTADLWAQLAANNVTLSFADLFTSQANYLGSKIWYNPTVGTVFVDQDTSLATPGTMAGDPLPGQTCGLISWHSALGGKKGRGRTYLPFMTKTYLGTTGVPTVAYQTLATVFIGAILTPMTVPNVGAGGGTLTLKFGTKHTVGTPGIPFEWNLGDIAAGFATQRRRGFFGRQNRPPL